MKNLFLGTLAFVATSSVFANPAVQADDATAKPRFSCSSEAVGEYAYRFAIQVSDDTLEVLQSSINARFAPLVYSIAETQPAGEMPSVEPKFSCTYSVLSAVGYSATIHVFEDSVFVLQSSIVARYAPIQYSILSEAN